MKLLIICSKQFYSKIEGIKNKLLNNEKSKNNENFKEKETEKYIKEFLKFNNINRDTIVNLIDKIEIFENKKINIKLTFSN